ARGEGRPPQGRLVHPLRRERGSADQRRQGASWHAHLRAGGPRAAREGVHEDHFARPGGDLMAIKIRRGDTVQVIAGDGKGKTGRVLSVDEEKQRVVVEKVNFIKRHTKARKQGMQSGILEREASIHLSNVQLYDPKSERGTRVGVRVLPDGTHER